LFSALAIAVSVAIVKSYQAQTADDGAPVATYSHGTLRVDIPYHADRSGAGQLTVEVLDPEDTAVGRTERLVDIGQGRGTWQEEIKLSKPLSVEDLVWHRLRYGFTYSGAGRAGAPGLSIRGTESISQILRTPVVHVMGQQSYLAGGPAAVRVIVTDSRNEAVAGPGSVQIELVSPNQKSQVLFKGGLNRRGTTEAQFRFPAGLVGSYPLRYVVDTGIGSTEFTETVRLEDKAQILLTTEKPIYQPGQTIHARALALDRSNHEATANRKLTFEVEDSRRNKVFKKATETDEFGVASADFSLADEVNLGTYHLRALMDAGNTADLALNVERYVLPKFKVAVEFAGKDSKAKHGYRPGDHVTGTVRANYFFGKAVDNGEVTVKASGMDVAVFEVGSVNGKTDGEGAYRFDLQLPRYFAGRPLSQGAARVLVEATVKDSAEHSESRGEAITVSQSPILITAVPEGGTLVPNLENQVYILTAYADGQPASADIEVRAAGGASQHASTDEAGVAVIRLHAATGAETLQVEARDKAGNEATSSLELATRTGQDQILLRTERAVYRAGEPIQLRVFSTRERGTAYVDAVKEGQTVLTRDVDIVNGQAELTLTATPDLAGTVDFNAYLFGRDARPVADHRLAFVQPADELKIEATSDAPVYKPGDDARIHFRVTNSRGEGVRAALGLQVVDEAVFALAEKQPGFAKVFFYLEQEVMKPRYEIHSVSMPELLTTADAAHERAGRALFAATEMVSTNKFEREFGRTLPQTKWGVYASRYLAQFQAQARRLAERLSGAEGDLPTAMAKLTAAGEPLARDAWGNDLRLDRMPWYGQNVFRLSSAGPDKRFNSGDDLTTWLAVSTRTLVGPPSPNGGSIDLTLVHDRGPFNGLADVAGTVVDATGAGVRGATVTVRSSSTGKVMTTHADDGGQFSFSAVLPGEYLAEVYSLGFRGASREFALQARDRAVLFATLEVGAVSESVTVEAQARPMRIAVGGMVGGIGASASGGFGPGHGGGVGGGIVVNRAMAAPPPPPADRQFSPPVAIYKSMNPKLAMEPASPASPAPHVRSYFPEALYINPEIITGKDGTATIAIPLADNITTWRMAMLASTAHGALGSGASSLKVFQDFFADLDLPVTLTQGDRVSIPVAVYNYSGSNGDVRLELQPEDWYALVSDVPTKNVAVEAGRVGGSQFTLEARRIGKFKLTLTARMSGAAARADVLVREIEVVPNGREQSVVFNGRLDTAIEHTVSFPPGAIADASKVFVRLYPGPLSQVIEGMDSILRMPNGCFEQTSSSTYPNVLALDYMKRTKKLTPEVHAKAEGYIANGYQRLVTFEVPGGGFSWFGQAPANKILTAYGLMEFSDMSKVYDVDARLIQRTQQWLAAQQQPDGSWKPDTSFINEGATNRFNSDVLRITAYVAWALEDTGYQGPAVEKARQYVEQHMSGSMDAYTLAVLANFAVDYQKDRGFAGRAMGLLMDARTEKDDQTWWTAEQTGVYGGGASASVETTGLAAQALLKWGQESATARKALAYIAAKKDASGTWGTTQATIMALRAVLLSTEKGAADVRGTLEVSLNGKPAQKLELTPENNDLLHQFVFKASDLRSDNAVAIRFAGKGGLAYQVVGSYFVPWDTKPDREALSIDVAYDRSQLAQDDIATATATVRNNLRATANMVMVDLGIPPGFDLLTEDLQAYQEKSAGQKSGRLQKFSLTATQAILYFDSFAAGDTAKLSFRLRAKYPIRARTFPSVVYEYYQPEVRAVAQPVQLEVRKK
jgi:uncharacterized protein YfaS (alpha-2-macroglobulin family)